MPSDDMTFFTILILCFTTLQVISADSEPKCTINVKTGMDFEAPPLVVTLIHSRSGADHVYAKINSPSHLEFNSLSKNGLTQFYVVLFCPSGTNQDRTANDGNRTGVIKIEGKPLNRPMTSLICLDGQWNLDGNVVDFKKITCLQNKRTSYSALLRDTGTKCIKGERYEIGHDLESYGFLKTIDLCFDKQLDKTVWVHAVIQPVNKANVRYTEAGSCSFKPGSLYKDIRSVNKVYTLISSYNNWANISSVDLYLDKNMKYRKYLARGHLIANKDMIYKRQQESTYFYANVLPMFQKVNAQPGNWFFVENYIRDLAYNKQTELDVWAGGLRILIVENKEIYMIRNSPTGPKIPVPRVIFKCVVDTKMKEALCFMVINNPVLSKSELERSKADYVLCKDTHKACETINKRYNDGSLGYMYCCSLRDFYDANKDEVGFEDLQQFLDYKPLSLL